VRHRPAAKPFAFEAERGRQEGRRRATATAFGFPRSQSRTIPAQLSSRSPASGFGSITSQGSRSAESTFPLCRSWLTTTSSRWLGPASRMKPTA
jgi:hypothetical protein